MDYTQNYHLPQWEKNDRVLMEDFNQMCERIEQGISTVKSTADTLASRISSNAASADAALKQGLFRNAYNRYHAATVLDPLPRQLGFFHQKLTPDLAGTSGFDGLLAKGTDALWLANSAQQMGIVNFKDYCTTVSNLSLGQYNVSDSPLVFDFNPPGAGCFSEILLMAGNASVPQNTDLHFRVTMKNLDTGKTDLDQEATVRYNNEFPSYVWIRQKLYFHQAKYRVTIAPVNTNYTGYYGYIPYGYTYISPSAALTQTVNIGETSADGFVSLVYDGYSGPSVTLKWDGSTISPHQTYAYTDTNGRAVKELLWRRGGTVPASTSLRLELNCPKGADITLYRWGMALI